MDEGRERGDEDLAGDEPFAGDDELLCESEAPAA